MRSYALFLALAVLHARAATIPAPDTDKKLPIGNDALDDVSLDNNESEQELVDPANIVKDVANNLRNSIPENVPVKIIEEQPIIKTITINENSNDYVPDNDDSSNIKRVEIDLNNPGLPQRQEHDSQKPVAYHSYVDNERAVAAIKQSIAESQNIFTRGIQDVTQKFRYYFANNEELAEVSKNIQRLRQNFDVEVTKLSNTINSYIKPEPVAVVEGDENLEVPSGIKEVENRLKTLETSFNYGVGMLSEGVELLSILKEEDEQNLKISGKADNENIPVETGAPTGTIPANPTPGSNPTPPAASNPVFDYIQNLNNTIVNGFNNLVTSIQNFWTPNQNQNQNPSTSSPSTGGFNPANLFQGITIPNIFQQNTNQNPQQQQPQGAAPAGVQSDDAASTQSPNILQQIQNTFQSFVSPGQPNQPQPTQQNQNPITQFFSGVNQGISNLFQPRPQQTTQQNAVTGKPATAGPAAAEGTNSVPAAPALGDPVKPPTPPEQAANVPAPNPPVQSIPAQSGPVQQILQNNPIVKGITNAVQRIQGQSNPSKPRDTEVNNSDSKGHGYGSTTNGDYNSGGLDETKSAPVIGQSETVSEIQDGGESAAALNKTE